MTSIRKPGPWFALIALLSLAAILYTRLIPFGFVWNGRPPLERLTIAPLTTRDVPLNMLLFVPFGFGLAGVLARRRTSGVLKRVVLISVLLSAALELIQMFMPERVPSLADVIANGLGALVGYGVFRAWETGFGRTLDRYATRRNLLVGLVLYASGAALLTAYLYRSVRLDNWDVSFPLVVGNEAVGKRQWSGQLEDVELAAGKPAGPAFIARYGFHGEAPFAGMGGSAVPPLTWREGPATAQVGAGVHVGPGEWLATDEPFAEFSEAARRFEAFTIQAIVATADPAQRGPARIVSVSADAQQRNITIGQEDDALIVRLRTPAGGENGQKPEVLVPGVFADQNPRAIVVSYDAPELRIEVDGEPHDLSLAPGLAFFPGFATENRYPVTMDGDPHRYDWAYWGIIVGLAVLLFGVPSLIRQLRVRRGRE